MKHLQPNQLQRQLELALIGFFVLVALSLVIVFAADPAVYAQILSLQTAASYPVPMTLFLVAILALIAVGIVGVLRHWRWVFWIILAAFGAAVLDIPITLLQLLGVFPLLFPVWYSWYRVAIACVQVVIAVWMARIAYHHGAWAMGRKKQASTLEAGGLDGAQIRHLH